MTRIRDAPRPRPAAKADPVTGLPSRQVFEYALDEATHRCDVQRGTLAVIHVGLDNFPLVDEAYGHASGDRLLGRIPRRLKRAVPDLVAAARNAGDEFMHAVPATREQAHAAAERLRAELRRRFRNEALELMTDVSIGIAMYPTHGARPRLLVQAAAAMRAVKQAGGGAHAEFEPAMGVDMRQQADLLRDLRHAVERRELQLVYQPKIDARSLQVSAAEALLRWHHPQRGVVSPAVFVPLAERHGLIAWICGWVIEDACRQANAWREQGLRMRRRSTSPATSCARTTCSTISATAWRSTTSRRRDSPARSPRPWR